MRSAISGSARQTTTPPRSAAARPTWSRKATATNEQGVTVTATSAATSAVLDAAPTVTTPTISGTVQEGQTLTASASAGEGDKAVSDQWQDHRRENPRG